MVVLHVVGLGRGKDGRGNGLGEHLDGFFLLEGLLEFGIIKDIKKTRF